MNTSKILGLLEERFEKIRSDLWDMLKPKDHDADFNRALEALWVEYLNGIDCEVVDQDDIVEEFENLFNFSSKTRICVPYPMPIMTASSFQDTYLLIPKELVEKVLVLGWFPDKWSPEDSRA